MKKIFKFLIIYSYVIVIYLMICFTVLPTVMKGGGILVFIIPLCGIPFLIVAYFVAIFQSLKSIRSLKQEDGNLTENMCVIFKTKASLLIPLVLIFYYIFKLFGWGYYGLLFDFLLSVSALTIMVLSGAAGNIIVSDMYTLRLISKRKCGILLPMQYIPLADVIASAYAYRFVRLRGNIAESENPAYSNSVFFGR